MRYKMQLNMQNTAEKSVWETQYMNGTEANRKGFVWADKVYLPSGIFKMFWC